MTSSLSDISELVQRSDGAMLAVINGRLIPVTEAMVPATDLGLVRGDGVFEVFQLYDGVPLALEEHLERLASSAAAIVLELESEGIRRDIEQLLAAIPPVDGNVRVIVTRSGTRVIMQEPPLDPPEAYRLALVPHLVTPALAGVKSLSYALNCHARRIAELKGCDDALLFSADDGQILEGPFTAFAWAENDELFTPPLDVGVLDSITRRVLLDATDVQERRCTRTELARAEGACVMGTGLELVPVCEIRDVCNFPQVAPVIRAAAQALSEEIQARLRAGSDVRMGGS
jgi:branched-subunit amino acid aminotransferase/4-amino-4-deoxychorismate lyase